MRTTTVKNTCLAVCAMACVTATAMPSRSELKKVQGLVNELMASDLQAMKSGKLKPSQVAANAEKLAADADGEAAKFLLYKGAFGLYVQGGSYDEAIGAIDRLNAAVKDVPDKVVAEILREKLKRIPKKNGSAIFNLYDGICRRMAAAEERGKLEKQLKASPADKQTRRLLAVRCAQMGDWEAAREHFSKLRGKEADAVKAEGSNFAEAADFWWGYQPGVEGVDEEPFREYAASLYRKAIDGGKLAGLKLVLAKKRIAEVDGSADEAQKHDKAADDAPSKGEVAGKPREEAKPVPRATGGARVDWALPKNFKGVRSQDLDLGDGETMTFLAVSAGKGVYKTKGWELKLRPHDIYITRPFWITQTPVTRRQFRLAGTDAEIPRDVFDEKFEDDKDAILIAGRSREDVLAYFDWLNAKFGSVLPRGWVFRLPTQGEALQMETGVRNGYKLVEPDEKKWIDVVHSKGLFADCQTYKQAVALRWKLKCSPGSLIVDANRLRRERNAFLSLDNKWFHALDRISMPGVNLKSFARGPLDQGLAPHLEKALNYRQKETDPFRYVADGTPDTWVAINTGWRPEGHAERLPFRVVAGPDYVGEWKAKNGK